jgi:spermidine/putrescine transport system substrate-binding protein
MSPTDLPVRAATSPNAAGGARQHGTPNIPANELTPEAIRANPAINVGAETLARLQIFEDIGAGLKFYDRAWNTIRTAQ